MGSVVMGKSWYGQKNGDVYAPLGLLFLEDISCYARETSSLTIIV